MPSDKLNQTRKKRTIDLYINLEFNMWGDYERKLIDETSTREKWCRAF